MSNKKQISDHLSDVGKKVSSVDWIINFFESGVTSREDWLFAKEQAKAMQKKQAVDFALKCMFGHVIPSQATREVVEGLFDEYYKEQFGGA